MYLLFALFICLWEESPQVPEAPPPPRRPSGPKSASYLYFFIFFFWCSFHGGLNLSKQGSVSCLQPLNYRCCCLITEGSSAAACNGALTARGATSQMPRAQLGAVHRSSRENTLRSGSPLQSGAETREVPENTGWVWFLSGVRHECLETE